MTVPVEKLLLSGIRNAIYISNKYHELGSPNHYDASRELASVLRLIAVAEHLVAMELKPERGDWEPLEKALAAIRKVQP